MNNRKTITPLALSSFAAGSFRKAFPEAKPFFFKRKKQRGAFVLNGKIVCAKWASYTKGNDANHKDGWKIMFPATYMPDLIVVFAREKLDVGFDYSKILIFPRSDFPCVTSIRLDENDEEYIYDAQDLRDAVLLNLGALSPSKKDIKDLDSHPKSTENVTTLPEVPKAKPQKAIEPVCQNEQKLTIEVSAVDYLAFKQIATVKKKGQQLLFHNMLNLYVDEKCRDLFIPNLLGSK